MVFFHFLPSEQTENKAFTCNTRQLGFFSQQVKGKDFGRRKACVAPHVTIYVTYLLQLSKLTLKNLHFCNNCTHHLPLHSGLRLLPFATVEQSSGNSSGVCSCGLKLAEVKLGNGG